MIHIKLERLSADWHFNKNYNNCCNTVLKGYFQYTCNAFFFFLNRLKSVSVQQNEHQINLKF